MATDTFYSPLFPNPIPCVVSVATQFSNELASRIPINGFWVWLKEIWEWHYVCFYIGFPEIYHIVLIAIGLTLFRFFLNFAIFKPIPNYFQIIKHDAEKFPESAWKGLIYTVTWIWATYLCCFSEEQYFFHLEKHWNYFVPGVDVPNGVYWLYMLQIGFYVHCVYASVFIETIRRDFVVLMIHHFLTLGLLGYSYGVRFHVIGLVVLFIQDIGDSCLEVTKSILYFKTRSGVDHYLPEVLANIGFGIFTLQWVLFRLYWSFTKVLYSTAYVSVIVYPNGPFYLSFNIMLMVLYGMQVYWFTFIVNLLIKIAQGSKVEDTRETDEDREGRKQSVLKEQKKQL